MKVIRKIIVWSVISLLIQCSGLFYLNKYYFAAEGSFKITKVEKTSTPSIFDAKIRIPDSAKISNDGSYIAFYDGDVLKVVDTKTGSAKSVQFDSGVQGSYFQWVPGADRLIISEKHRTSYGTVLRFSSYDVRRDDKEEIKDNVHDATIQIPLYSSKSTVQNMILSPKNMVMYVNIYTSGQRNSIYRINIMAEMNKVSTYGYSIGNMAATSLADKLIYNDLTYNKVRVTGLSHLVVNGTSNLTVLATDDKDNAYVGTLDENGMVKGIYYGQLSQSTDQWTSVPLSEPAKVKNIYVSESGDIYVNDRLKGIITDVTTGKQSSYSGAFLQIYDGGIASITSKGYLDRKTLN